MRYKNWLLLFEDKYSQVIKRQTFIWFLFVFHLSVYPSMPTFQSQNVSSDISHSLVCVFHSNLGWNCSLISSSMKGLHQCKCSFEHHGSLSPVSHANKDLSSLPHIQDGFRVSQQDKWALLIWLFCWLQTQKIWKNPNQIHTDFTAGSGGLFV